VEGGWIGLWRDWLLRQQFSILVLPPGTHTDPPASMMLAAEGDYPQSRAACGHEYISDASAVVETF
jgi:hypothetical protein